MRASAAEPASSTAPRPAPRRGDLILGERERPHHRHCGYPGGDGPADDLDGRLPGQRRAVHATLADDDQISLGESVVEAEQADHVVGSRREAGPERRVQATGHAAGGAAPRDGGRVPARHRVQNLREVGETGVELGDVLARRPLLRPEQRRRPALARERDLDVAAHDDVGLGEPRIERIEIDLGDPAETAATRWHGPPVRVEEAGTE